MAFSKFLDAKNDASFKKIFGSEKNKDILIHFLNNILNLEEKNRVESVEFLGTVWGSEILYEKENIVDIFCRDSQGQRFIVEMQLAKDKSFDNRALYYSSRAYSRQAKKSYKYTDLKCVFFIAVSNNQLFSNDIECVSRHGITEYKTHRNTLPGMQFVFIELPKFKKDKVEELENIVDCWCYFFKHAEETTNEDLKKIVEESPIMSRAYEELEEFSWSEGQLIAYEESILKLRKEEAIVEQKLDDATNTGIQIGQEKVKIEIARNLLKSKVSIDIISQSTGLSIHEVKALQEK